MSSIDRQHPEATPEEARALALREQASAGEPPADAVERECRDCGHPFDVPAAKAASGSKWYSLCGSCLSWEL